MGYRINYRLREWRERRRLSQREAAELVGIRQQSWSAIETGRHQNPHRVTLIGIARVLGCDVRDLTRVPRPGE